MKLDEILKSAHKRKSRKRVGRGTGSGHGKTCGRGHKGYGSRSGARRRYNYEGGQTPALTRTPKRGFSNAQFRREYQIVNLAALEKFQDGDEVTPTQMLQAGLIDSTEAPVKILGNGELTKKLKVTADKFSASAAEKIESTGGEVVRAEKD